MKPSHDDHARVRLLVSQFSYERPQSLVCFSRHFLHSALKGSHHLRCPRRGCSHYWQAAGPHVRPPESSSADYRSRRQQWVPAQRRAADDTPGSSVGVAGDVNGDGFHAVIVDAEGAETNGSERCQISGGCDGRLCRQVRARDWGLQRRWIRWVGGLPRRVRFDDQYLGRYVMKLLRTLRSNTGVIMSLPFSPDSQRLASGSRDHTIKMLVTTRWCSPDPTRTRL